MAEAGKEHQANKDALAKILAELLSYTKAVSMRLLPSLIPSNDY